MFSPTTLLLAILSASSILALPLDLQTEAAFVDARTVGKRTAAPKADPAYKPATEDPIPTAKYDKRWTIPPAIVTTSFGTECSLDTCDMCPTFPGCGEADSKPISAKENWAQPPRRRDEPETTPVSFRGQWEQPPRMEERAAIKKWIAPLVGSGVDEGPGPACSIHTCDMCPDHPGCPGTESEPPEDTVGA